VAGDNGVHSFSATLKTAGAQSLTATDTVTGTITGSQAGIVVNPAAASQLVVITDAANPDIAGTVFDVVVIAQDPYHNTDTNYTGTIGFSSGDPYGATLPANYTFQSTDQGMATFPAATALYTAGAWDITATDTASGITGSAFVTVQAAPAVAFQIIAPSSAVSGTPFDVTVIAVDSYGNTDTNYGGTVTWTTSDQDPGVVLPPDRQFQPSDMGQVTFPGGVTLITLGDQTLTATDTVSGINGSATVTVTSGPLSGRGSVGLVEMLSMSSQVQVAPVATDGTGLGRVGVDRFFTAVGSDQGWAPPSLKAGPAFHVLLDPDGGSLGQDILATDLALA
jgi:hypothetical protein